jgi:hypothetical protein
MNRIRTRTGDGHVTELALVEQRVELPDVEAPSLKRL